jgi:hypothetical protein
LTAPRLTAENRLQERRTRGGHLFQTGEGEMSEESYRYEVVGEIIKMIHDELPAVRWTCKGCDNDSCTIFFEPSESEKIVACEFCEAVHLLKKN